MRPLLGHAKWKRHATFAALLLVGALAATILLTSGLGSQSASATEPCANGTVVPNPADNPGLVADCAVLLAAEDTLRGTATLNWSADTPIADWTGITLSGDPQRVIRLHLTYANLDGSIPAGLAGLEQLQSLQLSNNALTGSIPAALGALAELQILYLHGNQLTGAIPAALGDLDNLLYLGLRDNQLTGAIPTEFASLWELQDLYLQNNQLSGAIPVELGDRDLRSLYLSGNSGLTGCIPAALRDVRNNDLADLDLSWCAAQPTQTLTVSKLGSGKIAPAPGTHSYRSGARVRLQLWPGGGFRLAAWGGACSGSALTCILTINTDKTVSVTFERITYTLTVTATAGGSVSPTGASTQYENAAVTLTASWTDATHAFSGWGGDCSGTEPTCELTMDADKTVTATFAERCQSATDPTCIRVVYLGAPDDYTQVADVPDTVIIEPQADGRYLVERGQQITVVTAAPLPSGYTRFYLQRRPQEGVAPTSYERLIPPVGTTYTFTVTTDERGPSPISFDLTAARPRPLPRPGQKPELGDVVVTTEFLLPLTLELASSRALCTANTLTELSWIISGGLPPYTLTIDGETVDAEADSQRANCGPIPADPMGPVPGTTPAKTFRASVTDSQARPVTATDSVQVELAEALSPPTGIEAASLSVVVGVSWTPKPAPAEGVSSQARFLPQGLFLVRHRLLDAESWTYEPRAELRFPWWIVLLDEGTRELMFAELRAPIEAETPEALDWSEATRAATHAPPENLTATATHNTVTVTWQRQPYALKTWVFVSLDAQDPYNGSLTDFVQETGVTGDASVTFEHLPPDAEFVARVKYGDDVSTSVPVRTTVGPDGYDYAAIP